MLNLLTNIKSGDSSSRISRNELHLYIEPAKEILVLGLKAGTRIPVERQRQELSTVEYLAAAITPLDFNVIIKTAAMG